MATTEEQKKAILPFLQRADEIGKVEPLVAYYCRLYAIQQGLGLQNRSPIIDGVLKALLNKLELEKSKIKLDDGDPQYCENFAITVFSRADKADRAGRADKNTAMTFYAASIFFEILNQFKGEGLENDLLEMQRYAAWKAADIRKALREGRTPAPGAPGDDPPMASTLTPSGDISTPGTVPEHQSEAGMPPAAVSGVVDLPAASELPSGVGASRFRAGARVFFDSNGLPVKGTVAKPNATGEGSEYIVALSDRIVTAPEASLAPDLEPGDTAVFEPARGEAAEVMIAEVDASRWPPTYSVALQNGAHMPAPHTQLTLLQRTSRPQSLDKQQFEESSAAAQASASHVAHDASSTTPTPPPPSGLAPLAGPSDYSTVGEAQDKHTGRSDMSQALLDNTAALEGNLSAAQRGDDVDFGEAEALGSAAGTAQPATALQPTATGPASDFQAQAPPPPPPQQHVQALPQHHLTHTPVAMPQPTPGFQPSLTVIAEAQKQAKYAASSLGFEDVTTAIKQLTDALKLLTQPGATAPASSRR